MDKHICYQGIHVKVMPIILRLNVRCIDWELIWILFHSIKGNYKLEFTIEQSGLLYFSLQRIKEWVWIAAKQCYVHIFS